MALEMNLQHFRIESDYRSVVQAINLSQSLPEIYGILPISKSVLYILFIKFFIPRASNVEADSLAKLILSVYAENIV